MSISDFTLSSPRKGTGKDKSFTYDEEFEKFLNDTSESEQISSNRYKNKSNDKPWWMKNENEDDLSSRNKNSFTKPKNFVKELKTTQLINESNKLDSVLKSDEIENVNRNFSNKYSDDFDDENTESNDKNKPRFNNIDNSSIQSPNYKLKKSFDKYDEISHLDEEDEKEDDKQSSECQSSSKLSIQSVIQSKLVRQNPATDKDIENEQTKLEKNNMRHDNFDMNNSTNLLSKVMFMETLGSNTLEKSNLNQTISSNKNPLLSKTASQKQVNFSNTETRRDLADLELVYKNIANFNDSGLNTLIKTTTASNESLEDVSKLTNQKKTESNDNKLFSFNSEFGLNAIKLITEELENRTLDHIMQVINNDLSKNNSTRNQLVKVDKKNKTNISLIQRLKNKTKNTQNSKRDTNNDENAWPPNKYKHIKGTGYGRFWSPKSSKNSSNLQGSYNSISKNQEIIASRSNDINKFTKNNLNDSKIESSNFFDEYTSKPILNYSELVTKLQDQLIKTTNEHEVKINRLKHDYENKLNHLRKEIAELNSKLTYISENKPDNKYKNDDLNIEDKNTSKEENLLEKKNINAELEEKLREQEKLIRGFQWENEKLYVELKKEKEKNSLIDLDKNEISNAIVVNNENNSTCPVKQSLNILSSSMQVSNYEETIKNLEQKLQDSNFSNCDLIKKLEYYEKNQQQIELDEIVIDQKNKEIKLLSEKLKKLELSKSAPECLKEIKILKKQLKEMDILMKGLRKNNKISEMKMISPVNLSLDYYEKRIQQLEAHLKDKSLEIDRINRMWIQKFHLNKNIYENHIENLEKNFDSKIKPLNLFDYDNKFEKNDKKEDPNENEIRKLKNLNINMRKLLDEFELRVNEKDKEIENLRTEIYELKDSYKNSSNLQFIESVKNFPKIYQPSLFNKLFNEDEFKFNMINDVLKENYSELELLKLKLANSQNELKLKSKDYEHEIDKLKSMHEQKLINLVRKHKTEINKMICLVDGYMNDNIESYKFDDNKFVLDDPITFKIINSKLENLTSYKIKCQQLEIENKNLNDSLDKLKLELKKNTKFVSKIEDIKDSNKILSLIKIYEMQLKFKNSQIIKFRNEMDNMLILLKTLQTK